MGTIGQSGDKNLEGLFTMISSSHDHFEMEQTCKLCQMLMNEYSFLSKCVGKSNQNGHESKSSQDIHIQLNSFTPVPVLSVSKKRLERLNKWIKMIQIHKLKFAGKSYNADNSAKQMSTVKKRVVRNTIGNFSCKNVLQSRALELKKNCLTNPNDSAYHTPTSQKSHHVRFNTEWRVSCNDEDNKNSRKRKSVNINDISMNNERSYHTARSEELIQNAVEKTSGNEVAHDFIIEEGLRSYYKANPDHFIERVSKGPPESFRLISWLILKKLPLVRVKDLYMFHKEKDINDMHDSAIRRDISRTLPKDEEGAAELEECLYKILRSFASIDSEILYCQGMNFIAGFLIIFSQMNEVDVFYLLLALFSDTFEDDRNNSKKTCWNIRGFYSEEFPLLRLYVYQFDKIFEKKLPNLRSHFISLSLPHDVWISRWFQTLFTILLPVDWCKRLWDCIFAYGLTFMFNFVIAFLKELQSDLLQFDEAIGVMNYFKEIQPNPLCHFSQTLSSRCSIEGLISSAKKIEISRNLLEATVKSFERDNNYNLPPLVKKYDLNFEYKNEADCSMFTEEDFSEPTDPNESNLSHFAKECHNSIEPQVNDFELPQTSTKLEPIVIIEDVIVENYDDETDEILIADHDEDSSTAVQQNMQKHVLNVSSSKSVLDEKSDYRRFSTINWHEFPSEKGSSELKKLKTLDNDDNNTINNPFTKKSENVLSFSHNNIKRAHTQRYDN